MALSVGALDSKLWNKDMIAEYLYKCFVNRIPAEIDLTPEGFSADALGLYSLLDKFCSTTGYDKRNITIKTGNMIESHPHYVIHRDSNSWYEINLIQGWLQGKKINSGTTPYLHFSNFISRTHWSRLWIATILDTYYRDKTLQTYHYDLERDNYNPNRYTGIDDLIKHGCNLYVEAVKFINLCPKTIDIDFLRDLNNTKNSVFQHENSYYPIQHPSNLNILQYYNHIFVDIVVETTFSGQGFFVSEKTWRPIIAQRPFIVVSNRNFLNNLRKLGFQTFESIWSENYDKFGGADRIHAVHELLDQISQWSNNELENKLISIKEILIHNKNVFTSLNTNKINEVFGA
jgi:hypothetical protein